MPGKGVLKFMPALVLGENKENQLARVMYC